jgi:hypothetical protein
MGTRTRNRANNINSDGTPTTLNSASVTAHAATFDDDKIQSNIALLGFKTAVNGSLAKYNLQDQIIDEFEDNSGIDAGASTNEDLNNGVYKGGIGNPTGGTVTEYGAYRAHTFTATGSFVTPASTGSVNVFVVAGGASGGHFHGGGGGAGGYKLSTSLSLSASTTYTATIGAGGAVVESTGNGNAGADSSFAGSGITTITALKGGGGAGAVYNTNGVGGDGTYGSGGGGVASGSSGGAGTTGQGYAGGAGAGTAGVGEVSGGGGGGASAVGSNSTSTVGGTGGAGIANDYKTGSDLYYAGGGGGRGSSAGGAGGSSVGGAGTIGESSSVVGEAGATNTGSGGGGSNQGQTSGAGADGTVIIRYGSSEYEAIQNLTLQSTANTASSAATKADLIMLMENGAGTASINVDIKGYVTANGGTNWTEGTLVDEGTWGTNKKIYAFHDATVTSGTDLRYKITTHNQVASSKETKIHAVSIGWKA